MSLHIPTVTGASLGKYLGISKQGVYKWVNGRRPIAKGRLPQIAAYFEGMALELQFEAQSLREEHRLILESKEQLKQLRAERSRRPNRELTIVNPDGLDPNDTGKPEPTRTVFTPETQPFKGDEHRAELFGRREDNISALKRMEW